MAVSEVSFGVPPGLVKAIIGPNGAGKTTLFNIITGFLPPQRGRILYHGEEIQGQPAHLVASRGIARTFQLVQLFDHMTVWENVMVGRHRLSRAGLLSGALRLAWTRREEAGIRQQAWEALEFVGLADRAYQPAAVLEMILALRDRGITILLVEHDMSLTMEVADEIVVLNYGRLIAEGPPRAIQKHPEVIAAYLGSDWQG
jgi:branched-chain amino acid transport system ATP-binding protein